MPLLLLSSLRAVNFFYISEDDFTIHDTRSCSTEQTHVNIRFAGAEPPKEKKTGTMMVPF